MQSSLNSRLPQIRQIAFVAIFVALAAIFILYTAWQLAVVGPFQWHIRQPETVQGGIEALVMIAALASIQCLSNARIRLIASLVVSEIYLRRHAVDFAVVIDLAYVEALIAIGCVAMKLQSGSLPERTFDYLRCFVLGLSIWSVAAWGISALGLGTVVDLRVMTVVLGLSAFAWARVTPLFVYVYRSLAQTSSRVCAAALLGWLLVLFAKTSVSFFFDSLWYGLRGEHVLVGNHGAYESLGLVTSIHYYPKLYELLLIPVSGLGNAGVITGMTLVLFSLLALTCNILLRQLGIANTSARIALTIACVSIPAISNSALDPKPDLLSCLLLMLGWVQANEFISQRRVSFALWSLACLVLATQAKLTAVPYAAAITLSTVVAFLRSHPKPAHFDANGSAGSLRLAGTAFGLALVVTAFVTARTLVLTGMPTIAPDQLFHLWQKLGFTLKPPVQTMFWFTRPVDWADAPNLAFDLLFRPQVLPHTVVYWVGNIWLWLGAIVATAAVFRMEPDAPREKVRKNLCAWIAIALIASGLYLMFGVTFGTRGSDGNYYLAAIVPGVLLGAAAAWRIVSDRPWLRTMFFFCVALFAFFQAAYSFMSAGWTTGTRRFDLHYTGGFHEYRKYVHLLMAQNGLSEIESYLRHLNHSARVVVCMQHELFTRLPARAEEIEQITGGHAEPDRIIDFLSNYQIEYVIIPHAKDVPASLSCKQTPELVAVAHLFDADLSVRRLDDTGYVMYDLTQWKTQHTTLTNRQ